MEDRENGGVEGTEKEGKEGHKEEELETRREDTERRASWDMELRQVARLSDSVFPISPFG